MTSAFVFAASFVLTALRCESTGDQPDPRMLEKLSCNWPALGASWEGAAVCCLMTGPAPEKRSESPLPPEPSEKAAVDPEESRQTPLLWCPTRPRVPGAVPPACAPRPAKLKRSPPCGGAAATPCSGAPMASRREKEWLASMASRGRMLIPLGVPKTAVAWASI